MDVAATIDAVRDETATERERLGSDKALVAATGATLETDAVLEAAATRETGVASALDRWAGEESVEAVADSFAGAASSATDRSDRIDAAAGDPDALSAHLETVEGVERRVGAGLVAVPLVADRFYLQVVNFFVNESDERHADLFREIRADAAALDRGEDALATLSDEGRETVAEAAVDAVGVAYEEYADTLAEMGLDPKPIC